MPTSGGIALQYLKSEPPILNMKVSVIGIVLTTVQRRHS